MASQHLDLAGGIALWRPAEAVPVAPFITAGNPPEGRHAQHTELLQGARGRGRERRAEEQLLQGAAVHVGVGGGRKAYLALLD